MIAEELIDRGKNFIRENNFLGALACFEKAYSLKKIPEIQSYLGLCIAIERGKISEAVSLCERAIGDDPENYMHYLNLAKIYMRTGNRDSALETLRKGLYFGDNAELKSMLDSIGIRKTPVIPFIPRSNFLNRYLGFFLNWIKLR
jgi:tetratricopeptide (TPR) repeat protein